DYQEYMPLCPSKRVQRPNQTRIQHKLLAGVQARASCSGWQDYQHACYSTRLMKPALVEHQPMEPSIWRVMSRFSSIAYSIGSSLVNWSFREWSGRQLRTRIAPKRLPGISAPPPGCRVCRTCP